MTIKEHFEREENNSSRVFLFKEGMFWKAYDRSAFTVVKQVKEFKINRVLVKNVFEPVLSIGFPDRTLEQISPLLGEIQKSTEKEKVFLLQHAWNESEYFDCKHRFCSEVGKSRRRTDDKREPGFIEQVSDLITAASVLMSFNENEASGQECREAIRSFKSKCYV